MRTPFISGTNTAPSSTATTYFSIIAVGNGSSTTENQRRFLIPGSYTLSSISMLLDAAPGAGRSWTFTVQKNGVDTSITFSITDTATTGSDLVNTVSFAAGDSITLKVVPAGTPAGTQMHWYLLAEGSNAIVCGGTGSNQPSTTAVNYSMAQTASTLNATETNRQQMCAVAGTMKNLYVQCNAAPGSGKSWGVTVVKNGTDTALTATIANTATTSSDTSNTVTVAAGDRLSIKISPSGTPTATEIYWGFEITPTVDGESPMMYGFNSNPSASATNYQHVCGTTVAWSATRGDRDGIAPAVEFRKLYAQVATAPGAGKSLAFTVYKGSVAQPLTTTISEANTSASDTSNSFTTAASDRISYECVPSGTPTISNTRIGMAAFIAPTTTFTPKLPLLGVG